MDTQTFVSDEANESSEEIPSRRSLPHDLPKSLDDRQPVHEHGLETEMYDAWQGTE